MHWGGRRSLSWRCAWIFPPRDCKNCHELFCQRDTVLVTLCWQRCSSFICRGYLSAKDLQLGCVFFFAPCCRFELMSTFLNFWFTLTHNQKTANNSGANPLCVWVHFCLLLGLTLVKVTVIRWDKNMFILTCIFTALSKKKKLKSTAASTQSRLWVWRCCCLCCQSAALWELYSC